LAIVDILRFPSWKSTDLRNECFRLRSIENLDEELKTMWGPTDMINCLYGIATGNLTLEWRFRNHDKLFSLLFIGLGDTAAVEGRTNNGRIVIISCRLSMSNHRVIRPKFVRKWFHTSPVYAIAKLDDQYFPWTSNIVNSCIPGVLV
jgi:hypothetical protein